MNKSINFYEKLMGLEIIRRRRIPENDAEIAFLQDPSGKGAVLELTFYKRQKKFVQAEYEERVFDHLAFEVSNMEATIAKLRKAKITITDQPFRLSPTGPLLAFIEDPDGILIELIERKKS